MKRELTSQALVYALTSLVVLLTVPLFRLVA